MILVVVQSIETGVVVPKTLKTNTATCLLLFGKAMGLGLMESQLVLYTCIIKVHPNAANCA